MTFTERRSHGRVFLCMGIALHLWAFTTWPQAVGQVDLGPVPFGNNGPVRLVEVGVLPDNNQHMIARGDKLYFALQGGTVEEFTKNPDGTLTNNPGVFLDVATQRGGVFGNNPVPAQNGLRGIAFHPDFDNNGKFYSMQTESRGGTPTHALDPAWNLGLGSDVDSVLTEWTFNPGTGALLSQREVYRVQFPAGHHPGQNIVFNPLATTPDHPDYGNLYIGFGDSGGLLPGADDFSTDNVISTVSQNRQTVLGKIIRIDPLEDAGSPFSIPEDNPFTSAGDPGDTTLDEIFAIGFRHPAMLSFDSESGKLLSADISHNNLEEINLIESGKNYGWSVREGTYEFQTQGNSATLAEVPLNVRQSDEFTYPVAQYDHVHNLGGAAAIVGGFVYHGTLAPQMNGKYVFGNLSTDQIFFAAADDLVNDEVPANIFQQNIVDDNDNPISFGEIVGVGAGGRADMRFGQDSDGELYIISKRNETIYRFESASLVVPPSILGDLDLDGFVTPADLDDFIAGWRSTFAVSSLESWMAGDLNLDATVNLADVFLMHGALVGAGVPSPFGAATSVPEPTTCVFAVASLLGLVRLGRNRRGSRQPGRLSSGSAPSAAAADAPSLDVQRCTLLDAERWVRV